MRSRPAAVMHRPAPRLDEWGCSATAAAWVTLPPVEARLAAACSSVQGPSCAATT